MERLDTSRWRKSSHSGSNGGGCVEVGQLPGMVAVRDTQDQQGPVLAFAPRSWQAFTGKLKDA